MPVSEIYIKLVVGFPRDPKVRALVRYGADAGLGRDLYVSMVLYCKENLTDGYVPAEEVGVLAYPLPVDHANQIAKQLASVGLIKEVSNEDQQGWLVCAYLRRNGSKKDVERLSQVRAAAGRKGGRPPRETARQKPAQANRNQIAKQNESRPNPKTETESKTSPLPPTQHPLMYPVPDAKPGEGEESQDDQTQTRDVAVLVVEIREIRPDWSTDSIVRTLNDPGVLERPWPVVRVASLIVARDPASQLFGRLKHDGPWWPEARALVGRKAPPPPGVKTHRFEPDCCNLPENNHCHREVS